MKKEDLFKAIENIDDELIRRSEIKIKSKVFPMVMKLGIAAACLGIVVFAGTNVVIKNKKFHIDMINENQTQESTGEPDQSVALEQSGEEDGYTSTIDMTTAEDVAYGFVMNDRIYYPISFEERKEFGLVSEEDYGLTAENTYVPGEKDLGEKIGEIETSENKGLVGASVYHYNAFPENEKIAIVERNGEYSFFVFSHVISAAEEGMDSNSILNVYGIKSASVKSINVLDDNSYLIATIIDGKQIDTVVKAISDKRDIGLSAHEQLYADKWYEAYGTNEVYYDGETMHYGTNDEEFTMVYEKAHKLWNSSSCILEITTIKGLGLYFYYNPTLQTVSVLNSFYQLSDAEAKDLNDLVNLE